MKATAIIASRMGSSRLPGKAMLPILGIPMLVVLIRRLKESKKINRILLATTNKNIDKVLVQWAVDEGIETYCGSEEDVLGRFVEAARTDNQSDYIVRVTADCPFVNGELLDYCLDICEQVEPFDLATTKRAFPIGLDFELYRKETLERINRDTRVTKENREHVTQFIYNFPEEFKIIRLESPVYLKWFERPFTVDALEDYTFARNVFNETGNIQSTIDEIIEAGKLVLDPADLKVVSLDGG